MNNIGNRIKEIRQQNNLKQGDFGKIIDANQRQVSNWEVGISEPSIDYIKKISKKFNCSTDYLLGIDDDDYDNLNKLKRALNEANLMVGDDLTLQELEKALEIVKMIKK